MSLIEHDFAVADRAISAQVINADAKSIMDVISRAAADPQTDVGKLERLVDLYDRITAQAAKVEFARAMADAQAEMPLVLRDAINKQTSSRYATLDKISTTIDPIIHKHGFSLSFGTDRSLEAGHYGVICITTHIGGHSMTARADIPVDIGGFKGNQNKTQTHAFGSTMSYARRYLKLMVFDVTLTNEDDDGNAAGGRHAASHTVETVREDSKPVDDNPFDDIPERKFISEQQVMNIRDLLQQVDGDETKFLKHIKVATLDQIYLDKYEEVIKLINTKRKAGAR